MDEPVRAEQGECCLLMEMHAAILMGFRGATGKLLKCKATGYK